MRILIANDDGLRAEGIRALARELGSQDDMEVIVAAPLTQQSGMAHALTVARPVDVIRCRELDADYRAEVWGIGGTPTDCVKLYMEALNKQPLTAVVSGINHGANLATDVLYSGTVGAAMEGFLHDTLSFAVSLDSRSTMPMVEVARIFRTFLRRQLEQDGEPRLWNVNFPRELAAGEPRFVAGRLGRRDYINAFALEQHDADHMVYTMQGEIADSDDGEATDLYAVAHGWIAVTPLHTDMADMAVLDELLQS